MTSTEFTVGIGDNGRVSSKVLKPPGGGSSDIFGLGSAGNNSSSDKSNESNTHSRLFGGPSEPGLPIPQKKNTLHQSSIFENGQEAPAPRGKKHFVRHNPITGEEIVVETEIEKKTDCDNEAKVDETTPVPNKPVQTSIRVRNPPGGKSSGIF